MLEACRKKKTVLLCDNASANPLSAPVMYEAEMCANHKMSPGKKCIAISALH